MRRALAVAVGVLLPAGVVTAATSDEPLEPQLIHVEVVPPAGADPTVPGPFPPAPAHYPPLPTTTTTTSTTAPPEPPSAPARQSGAVARQAGAAQSRAGAVQPAPRAGGAGGDLAAIRACESGGDYGAVSANGRYRGAYQFDAATWQSVGGSGDPAVASPGEQDARAAQLRAQRGGNPWPNCG